MRFSKKLARSVSSLFLLVLALHCKPALAQAGGPAVAAAVTPSSAIPKTVVPETVIPETAAPPTDPAAPIVPQRHTSSRRVRTTPDQRIAVLSKNLNLTEAQRTAVKKILEQRQQATLAIRNSGAPGDVRIGQFRALQDRTIKEIRAVLTDEQRKKYDPMMVRQVPAADTPQRSVEDWIKATTPHETGSKTPASPQRKP